MVAGGWVVLDAVVADALLALFGDGVHLWCEDDAEEHQTDDQVSILLNVFHRYKRFRPIKHLKGAPPLG